MIDVNELAFPAGALWLPPQKLDALVQEHLGKPYDTIEAEEEISGNGELKIFDLTRGEVEATLNGWNDSEGGRKAVEDWLVRDEVAQDRWDAQRTAPNPVDMIAYLIERKVLPEAQYYVHIDW